MKKKKADPSINPEDITPEVNQYHERERRLFPLRVSSTTIILVPKDKCTPAYAKKYYSEKLKRI